MRSAVSAFRFQAEPAGAGRCCAMPEARRYLVTFLGRAVVMLLAACAVAGATAQDCTVADFRIVKANVLALRCSELRPHVTERRVTVIELDAAGIASGASISGDAKLGEVAR